MKKYFVCFLIAIASSLLLCGCSLFGGEEIERGETTSDSYINESINIKYNLPYGWRFYSDREVADIMDISLDLLKDKDLFDSRKVKNAIEFVSTDSSGQNSVNLAIEKMNFIVKYFISLEKYAEITKKTLQEQMPNAKYTFGETRMVELGGEEYLTFTANCYQYNTNLVQYVYIRKVGSYVVCITAGSGNGKSNTSFENMFE